MLPQSLILRIKILQLEQAAHEFARTFSNHHAVWLCNALQACCEVRRIADDAAFLRFARTYEVADNGESGCNTDARLQRD